MKKITLTFVLLISAFVSFAQSTAIEDNARNNEVKINTTNLIGFKWVDFTYERLINEESSFGVGLLVTLNDEDTGLNEYRTFSLTPYYRHFFSNKYAEGFFVEGFTMLHSGKDEYYTHNIGGDGVYHEDTYTDFAVGVSTGFKIVSNKGFVAEFYIGLGRDLLDKSYREVVTRGGLSIGYRF